MKTTAYDAYFFRHRFHLSTLETGRFQKILLSKPFSKASIFIIIFGRLSVDDRQKRIETFLYKNALKRFYTKTH